jgi:hypothetical protein
LGKDENELKNDFETSFELDFEKSRGLIESSFQFDYKYNPYKLQYLHWYDFYNDLQNLSTSEFGTCCPLNRIISILNQDASKIKESKDRNNLAKLQKELRRKYCKEEESKKITKEQKQSVASLYKELGLWKGGN